MFCSVLFAWIDVGEVQIGILVLHWYMLRRICTVLYVNCWAYQFSQNPYPR